MFTDGKCELESLMKVESIIDVLTLQHGDRCVAPTTSSL